MYKDVDGNKLIIGDNVELFSLVGTNNATEKNSRGTKEINHLGVMGGTQVAYFVEGGGCHSCDAVRITYD